eukprot:8364995-Alexandrium_andersonii.AAC.1
MPTANETRQRLPGGFRHMQSLRGMLNRSIHEAFASSGAIECASPPARTVYRDLDDSWLLPEN